MLFVEVILPVFVIVAAGYLLEKGAALDFRTLTYTSLYLFTPALVFASLSARPLRLELAADLALFMLLYTGALCALVFGIGRLLRLDGSGSRALALTTVVMNVGNFGLPLAYFAFGDAGLEVSVLTFVLFNIPLSTLAIALAQGPALRLGEVLRNTAKIPIFHALLLALALKAAGLTLPLFLLRPLELMGQGAIPLMLVLLGMQLARTEFNATVGFISLSALLRLAIAPLVAWGLSHLLGLSRQTAAVVILQTSTPSAILPLLYSLRFGTRPDLVAGAIGFSTLLSAATLTVILYLLR